MPAFMFEKISSPVNRAANVVGVIQPRGVIVQMLDRLAANRLQREARAVQKSRNVVSFTEADISPTRTRDS